MRTHCLALAVAVVSTGFVACTSSQPGTNGRAEIKTHRVTGEVTTLASADLDRVFDQAVRTVEDDYQFTIEKQNKDALVGVIRARTADEKTVMMTMTRKSDAITHISVAAGALNDGLSRSIVQKILDRVN